MIPPERLDLALMVERATAGGERLPYPDIAGRRSVDHARLAAIYRVLSDEPILTPAGASDLKSYWEEVSRRNSAVTDEAVAAALSVETMGNFQSDHMRVDAVFRAMSAVLNGASV